MGMYIGFAVLCFLDAGYYLLLVEDDLCVAICLGMGIVCIATAICSRPPK